MGKFFTSFDEAWSYFLDRREPLEWFFGDFPEEESSVAEGWLVEAAIDIKNAALELQKALAHLDWLAPVPAHFLHVWLAGPVTMGSAPDHWPEAEPFDIEFRRVNCFHSAVVVEAHGDGFASLIEGSSLDMSTFLPHLTIAVTRAPNDPAPLRDALLPLRDVELGVAVVAAAKLVRFPAARTTLLQPWDVVRAVALGRGL